MNSEGFTTFINAGGKGSRLASIFPSDPELGICKAMLPLGPLKLPLIQYQLNTLKCEGIYDVIVCVGRHETAKNYLDNSKVKSLIYAQEFETGGNLIRAVREIPDMFQDDILILNVDTFLSLDKKAFMRTHRFSGSAASIALTTNTGVPNEQAYYIGADGKVIYCDETIKNVLSRDQAKVRAKYQASSTGALIIGKEFLKDYPWKPEDGEISLYREVIAEAITTNQMSAFNNGRCMFIDVGTVDTWQYAIANFDTIQYQLSGVEEFIV